MADINFVPLEQIAENQILALMRDERVGQQMPLLKEGFSVQQCRAFVAAKKQMWEDFGFGPQAFVINGKFAGWGGLQPEQGEADFALVLHPDFWGWGRLIFDKVRDQAFNQMKLPSITLLFPPSRINANAIKRLGFKEEGQLIVGGEIFKRFRLRKDQT